MVEMKPHRGVRKAAARIIRDQRQEIVDFTSWLKEWYGRETDQAAASMAMHGEMTCHATGTPTEAVRTFLQQMADHHGDAVRMGELAVAKATRQGLGDRAWAMVASQRQDQDRFGAWLAEWYPRAVAG